jgi:hypothetical protein
MKRPKKTTAAKAMEDELRAGPQPGEDPGLSALYRASADRMARERVRDAAPELLAALKRLAAACEDGGVDEEARDAADSAIRKAEGRP